MFISLEINTWTIDAITVLVICGSSAYNLKIFINIMFCFYYYVATVLMEGYPTFFFTVC